MSAEDQERRWVPGQRIKAWLHTGGYYHFLLVLLFVLILIQPLGTTEVLNRRLGNLSLASVVVACILAVGKHRSKVIVSSLLAIPVMIPAIVIDEPSSSVALAANLSGLTFLLFVAICILADLFRQRRVSSGNVSASLCVYLLIGLCWAFVYSVIYGADPEAFRGIDTILASPSALPTDERVFSELFYFSMVTMTTLGYGDITPVSDSAQIFAVLEAIVGQLFLVVLVARLVGLHVGGAMADESP